MSDRINAFQEEQRPVLTIVILVSGVVGGLVVVITVVYFYRFCLKKRPPITTTGKPEHKRDQIRSQATCQCRPLPIPPVIADQPTSSVTSHYQHFLPQLEANALPSPDKIISVKVDDATTSEKVVKHFPIKVPVIVATDLTDDDQQMVYKNERTKKPAIKGNYLSIDGVPPRPQSAEMFLTVSEDEERRRASMDAYHRPVRRQLPNIEYLKQQQATYRHGGAPSRRRISELPRSAAIALHSPPRKQTSSPLPEVKQHRIYERGHIFSKSWNPERYIYYETSPDVDSDASVPTQIDGDATNPYKKFYHEMMRVFGSDPRVNDLTQERVAVGIGHRSNVRSFCEQTKSFDDHRTEQRRSTTMSPRSMSEAEQRQLVRQQTVFHLQPQNEISKECINLWADRNMFELNSNLMNHISTDLSTDQSASTSFESNTEPTVSGINQRRHSSFLELPPSADTRRQKYKSLLLYRQHLSNAINRQASSFESALSSESSAADSFTVNGVCTTSFDSTRSEQTDQDKSPEMKFNRQLSDCREDRTSLHLAGRNYLSRVKAGDYVPLARRAIDPKITMNLQRDYSVDSKTDRLFKEFVKIDPKFEINSERHNNKITNTTHSLSKKNAFSRYRTNDLSDASKRVSVPLICFPD